MNFEIVVTIFKLNRKPEFKQKYGLFKNIKTLNESVGYHGRCLFYFCDLIIEKFIDKEMK